MLQQNIATPDGAIGRLPAMAPLANPYVPFQLENPPQYETPLGFARGTLFPGLDLPYRGMVNSAFTDQTPLTQLQMLAFAIQEFALYLDTHRNDQQALDIYRMYQEQYRRQMEQYQQTERPLNHQTPTDGPYAWLDDPWPWEYAENQVEKQEV